MSLSAIGCAFQYSLLSFAIRFVSLRLSGEMNFLLKFLFHFVEISFQELLVSLASK